MSLTEKLVNLVHKIATGDIKTKILLTLVVGILYLSLIAGFVLVAFIVDNIFYFPHLVLFPWNLLVAIPLFILGFVLMLLSILYFIKAKGTPVPFNPPQTLVEIGLYRYIRNPMLTGIFLQMFGIGFYCHSISSVFIFTPLFILLNYWELKNIEEPELEKRFGQQYRYYKKRTSMFFPKIK